MPRYDEATNTNLPEQVQNPGEMLGFRHWGDGIAGRFVASRLQAYNATGLAYQDILVDDATGGLIVTGSGVNATEYTEGDTDASFSGIIALVEGPSNTATPLQVDASGHLQIDIAADSAGIGGGVQYTEGDTDASITGTALLWEDAADTLRAASSANPFPVEIIAGGAGDGAILDGVSSSIKATVLDYTNSNPLAVRLTDTNGDYVAAGAGTQYTEDAASAADPVGGMLIGRRRDTLSGTEVSADGDNIALNATSKGELYVKQTDAITVTGVATAANQTTVIGHLDGVEGLLTTIDGDTGTIAGAIKAEDAGHTTGDVGVMALAVRNDSAGTTFCANGDYSPIAVDSAGRVGITDLGGTITVGPVGLSTGGLSIFRSIDLDESEEEAKGSAGTVYGWYIANLATSTRFVKFYNATAANVTVGTTTPVLTLPVPGNSTDDVAANVLGGVGIKFDTAITVAATTGVADNDSGAPGANEVVINVFYA